MAIGGRTLAVTAFCGLVGLVAYAGWGSETPEPAHYVAARAMNVNHVIQPGDIGAREGDEANALGKLTGQFSRSDVRAGQIVAAEDFSPVPLLRVPNRVLVDVPVPGSVAGANAGTAFRLCYGEEEDLGVVEAIALLCDGTGDKRSNCSVVAALEHAKALKVLAKMPGTSAHAGARTCKPPEEESTAPTEQSTAPTAQPARLPPRPTRPRRN